MASPQSASQGELKASLGNLGRVGLRTEGKRAGEEGLVFAWGAQCQNSIPVPPSKQTSKQQDSGTFNNTSPKQTTNKDNENKTFRIDVWVSQTSQPSEYR